MKRNILIGVLLTFCLFSFAAAPTIEGKWKSKMKGPDGDMEMVFVFKLIKGDSISGVVQSPMGDTNISRGKVTGDSFYFDVDFNDMKIHHQGKVTGDSISLKVSGLQGEDMVMILKGAK